MGFTWPGDTPVISLLFELEEFPRPADVTLIWEPPFMFFMLLQLMRFGPSIFLRLKLVLCPMVLRFLCPGTSGGFMLLAVDGGRPLLFPGAWIACRMFWRRDWLDFEGVAFGMFEAYYEFEKILLFA